MAALDITEDFHLSNAYLLARRFSQRNAGAQSVVSSLTIAAATESRRLESIFQHNILISRVKQQGQISGHNKTRGHHIAATAKPHKTRSGLSVQSATETASCAANNAGAANVVDLTCTKLVTSTATTRFFLRQGAVGAVAARLAALCKPTSCSLLERGPASRASPERATLLQV